MKVYIGGKVTGLKNYKENFDKAEKNLKEKGHLCMNPSVLAEGFPWDAYMPICYAMIDACDCIYLLKNWIDSKGTKMELEYAKSKRKVIMYEE